MNRLAVVMIRPGEYVAAQGDHMVGRIRADQWHGLTAVTLDGRELPGFDSLTAAGEVLALEFALHYGDSVTA